MSRRLLPLLALLVVLAAPSAVAGDTRNLIIFVADGLRSQIVTPETAPHLAALRAEGVDFQNSHSLMPTLTTPNASTIATGHLIGDTGNFGNSLLTGFPVTAAHGSQTPFIENDPVLREMDDHFHGNYLHETSILAAARKAGYLTAAIGKLGPAAIQDLAALDGEAGTLLIDDDTGHAGGPALPADIAAAVTQAGLSTIAVGRGENGSAGDWATPGTRMANQEQQDWFMAVTTHVLLPRFRSQAHPFVMVYWSRDPDGSQHNQGDSLNSLIPGINGPTSLAAIRNADDNLGRLRQTLRDLGLEATTDILVTADHGFSTISKQGGESAAAKLRYPDVPEGLLPPGFLAIDLSLALKEPLFDSDGSGRPLDPRQGAHPRFGSALIGKDPTHPGIVVAANGGADLIYLPGGLDRRLARRLVNILAQQDYVSGIFANDGLGGIPGTLPMSAIGLSGNAITPQPALVVGFRSQATGCPQPEICTAVVADSNLQQGQGMHGSFSRADSHNFMAAAGPSFKRGFVDPAPTSNADIGRTAAHLLGLDIPSKGGLRGRILAEALIGQNEAPPTIKPIRLRSSAAGDGFVTMLTGQEAGGQRYVDAAGTPGRTVGLP